MHPCEICARLNNASAILAESSQIAALAQTINEFIEPGAPISPEQMASIAAVVAEPEEGTQYAAAGQWLDALTEYVAILNTDMGFSTADSVEFARKYTTPITAKVTMQTWQPTSRCDWIPLAVKMATQRIIKKACPPKAGLFDLSTNKIQENPESLHRSSYYFASKIGCLTLQFWAAIYTSITNMNFLLATLAFLRIIGAFFVLTCLKCRQAKTPKLCRI